MTTPQGSQDPAADGASPYGRSALVTIGETLGAVSSENVAPLRHARSLSLSVGGAESNVAIGAARLGTPAAWIGRVGADELGLLIGRTLRGEGVRAHTIVDSTSPTALMLKSRRSADRSQVQYYRTGSAGAALRPEDIDTGLVRGARVLHISGITPLLSATARAACYHAIDTARAAGVLVSCDFNFRSAVCTAEAARAEYRELAARSNLVLASEAEAAIAVDAAPVAELAGRLLGLGAETVVVKRGEDGAFGCTASESHHVPAVGVTAVDHVGAGDAFAAGFLSELIDGADLLSCLRMGARVGAYAVATHGDWEGLPTRAELDAESSHTDNVLR